MVQFWELFLNLLKFLKNSISSDTDLLNKDNQNQLLQIKGKLPILNFNLHLVTINKYLTQILFDKKIE